MRIAIDAMGGDFGPRATVRGAAIALMQDPTLEATLFGPRPMLEAAIATLRGSEARAGRRLAIIDAPSSLPADPSPAAMLRQPATSGLHACLQAVRDGRAQACVSAAHTGTLMALARRILGMIDGVTRPAISTAIPARARGRCYLLDLGANVDCRPMHLLQFARMGAEMARVVDGLELPRVALLNVATEPGRGERRIRETDVLLREMPSPPFRYCGFVEGDGLFSGNIDVAVCDGMVGNVALKSSEGLARLLGQRLQAVFDANWRSRLVSLLARPALMRFHEEIDPVRYNGASLLGLRATVVKSHGNSDARGFAWAILRARNEAAGRLPQRLAAGMNDIEPS